MDENTFWLSIWVCVGFIITSISVTVIVCCHLETKQFIEKGYIQTVLPGCQSISWIKP